MTTASKSFPPVTNCKPHVPSRKLARPLRPYHHLLGIILLAIVLGKDTTKENFAIARRAEPSRIPLVWE